MSELAKICKKSLADSKKISFFAVRNAEALEVKARHISTAHKAEFLRQVYFGSLARFAKTRDSALFLSYGEKNFRSQMRNATKNLGKGVQGTPVPTQTERNTVTAPKKGKSNLHYYIAETSARSTLSDGGRLNVSRIFRALSPDEAVGKLCLWVKENHPHHAIIGHSIACDTFNFINPKQNL